MIESNCGEVRELLPLHAEGALADPTEVVEHIATCAECGAELELVRVLAASRPAAPDGLASTISAAVLADASLASGSDTPPAAAVEPGRRRSVTPWWQLTAAAVAALALGVGVTSSLGTPDLDVAPEYASELEEGDLFVSGDGLLAGAPALEALSDEALMQFLDELQVIDGGAA